MNVEQKKRVRCGGLSNQLLKPRTSGTNLYGLSLQCKGAEATRFHNVHPPP